MRGPQHRFGDLFPLPVLASSRPDTRGLGRASAQRLQRNFAIDVACDSTVTALNELAGFPDQSAWPVRVLNMAQQSSLTRIRGLHTSLDGPRDVVSDEASLREMLKTRSGYASVGELESYRPGAPSIPREQSAPLNVKDVLGGGGPFLCF